MFLIILVFLILFLSYFSNYLRVFYYVSKLPGPTAYPIIGNALLILGTNEDALSKVLKLFKDYSPFFRAWLGPVPIVCTSNPDFVQRLLTGKYSMEKSFLMKYIGKEVVGNSIIISEVPKWKHNRNIIAQGFTPAILQSYFEIFLEKSLMLCDNLDVKLNDVKSFDIFQYLSQTSLDTICASTMGVNSNDENNKAAFYSAIENVLHLSVERSRYFWNIPKFIYCWSKSYKKHNESMKTIQEFANNVILQKKNYCKSYNNLDICTDRSKNEFKKPLLEFLIDLQATNLDFTEKDLGDEANLVIIAGYETSATALSSVLLNLAVYKDVQNKVYEELFQVLGSDLNRTINFDDLPKLTYMEMVMKESMRLFPIAPFIIRELTDDIQLGDCLIPRGVSCAVSIYALHCDEKIWENPLKFDPERFTPENSIGRHPYAYIPFSGGPRNCIGMRYAWMFMKTVLATLLSRYEFHTDLNTSEFKFEFAVTMKLIGGYQIQITPRKNDFLDHSR
uniref:Cytochrome P450 CYP4416B2 n=1 Tax=Chrysoperla zastrowi sillemi TaxID=482137 RepID=A0A9E8BW83_9NEOP|nr:cytochrome P450 CYP4416B2 [Chrysoperla zastrowi sillemi]